MPRRNFTHLLKADAELMQEFLDAGLETYDHIDYDVHVGNGRDPGPEFDDNMRRMAIQLSQRRIDAVAHRPGHIDIIEITLEAGLTALGQLMVYPALYLKAFPTTIPIRSVLVARAFSTDVEDMYKQQGIAIFLFPA